MGLFNLLSGLQRESEGGHRCRVSVGEQKWRRKCLYCLGVHRLTPMSLTERIDVERRIRLKNRDIITERNYAYVLLVGYSMPYEIETLRRL